MRNSQPHRKFIREAHRVLKDTQAHPPMSQYLKGHNPLVQSVGSDRKLDKSKGRGIISSLMLPHIQLHNAATYIAPP